MLSFRCWVDLEKLEVRTRCNRVGLGWVGMGCLYPRWAGDLEMMTRNQEIGWVGDKAGDIRRAVLTLFHRIRQVPGEITGCHRSTRGQTQ